MRSFAPESAGRRTIPAWVGDLAIAAIVVGSALLPLPAEELRPRGGAGMALVLLPLAVIPLRRRLPRTALGVAVALVVAALVGGVVSPGAVVVVMVAMFSLARRLSRRATVIAAAAAVAVLVPATIVYGVVVGVDAHVFQIALVITLAAAVGDGMRSRHAYLMAVLERAQRAEQTREAEAVRRLAEERLRIARDLHDAVAHQVSVISLHAGVAASALETRPERARESLSTIREASRAVLGEIGAMLAVLRSPGEPAALEQPGLARLGMLVESMRVTGLDVTVREEGGDDALPLAVDIIAYRVIQEGLTNALKHGSAGRAQVLLDRGSDRLRVVVTNPVDRGAIAASGGSGYGLVGLRERVESAGGTLEAGRAPGGYRLAVSVPLAPSWAEQAESGGV